ncbi:MAG: HEAT repeat domain-containing protein [Planctomycetes bacterium]|nr:HEAT repeat domain-containing protein [Planctomycetota bacterium]
MLYNMQARNLILPAALLVIVVAVILGIYLHWRVPDNPLPTTVTSGNTGVTQLDVKVNQSVTASATAGGDAKAEPPVDRRRQGLDGPFPTDDKVPETERQIGQMLNAWRQAIVIKHPQDIDRLGFALKGAGPAAVPFLKKMAAEDTNERVRAFAARVLGRMEMVDLIPFFIDRLQKDSSIFVRENAAWSLGKLNDEKSVAALQNAANTDSSERVRTVAQESLRALNK